MSSPNYPLILSDQAQADYEDILAYTLRSWGRVGKPSQTKIDLHATEQAAQAAMEQKKREKRKREYA